VTRPAQECPSTDRRGQLHRGSRRSRHRLVARYKEGGLDAVEPRSRKPLSNPKATEDKVRDFIVRTRLELTAAGWDAGPVTIAWHFEQAGMHVPPASTIRRILHSAGLVTPEPRKRPRSSYRRFEAAQPNECWQSDFTHWALAGGADAEIINWPGDHSRYLLGCSAWAPVTGKVVAGTFLQAGNTHGLPAATLTDNGRACTARFGGGRNAFEYLLAALGITQKNGHPFHPQTQGKVERFHQTQKRWLGRQPPAATLPDLQRQLDAFREHYNERRPSRAVQRSTPGHAYRALPKAGPAAAPHGYYRLRYDHVDAGGKVSIRHAGRMHHLGIGITHRGKEILAIADTASVTVIELRTGEVLSAHDIDPARSYWRNKHRSPGRWPGLPVT
jgi:transposase InsO family protein